MINTKGILTAIAAVFVILTGVFLAAFLLPWETVDWGSVKLERQNTITVTGFSKLEQQNQLASFSAGVEVVSDNKEEAIEEVNTKIAGIIEAVKASGIPEEDIKTQNISVYQGEEMYTEDGVSKSRKGQWRVSNNIDITLRDITKVSEFASLLTENGATNIFGPNYRLDDTSAAETELVDKAMQDAKAKADAIAKSAGKKIGSVLSVTEGTANADMYYAEGRMFGAGGGGFPSEPGTSTVTKYITVTYELR